MKLINLKKQQGFTLIEILVVIGIIAVLALIVLVAINPARQFAQSRNTQRTSNAQSILNAIGQNMADNKGVFACAATLPAAAADISKSGGVDLRPCLVPTYISELPYDPSDPAAKNTCTTAACSGAGEDYNTKYTVFQDTTTKRVTVAAPATELGIPIISITR